MSRKLIFRVWNSKTRLSLLAIFLSVLSLVLNTFCSKSNIDGDREDAFEDGDFDEDMDYVLESLQYMRDLKLGKAKIRPVIEKQKALREYWWRCYLAIPRYVSQDSWIKNEDFYLYSATYDRRQNSLYPDNHVVQVLAISFRSIPSRQKVFCNLYDTERLRYVVVEGHVREIWQRAWDPRDFFYVPNLISCPVPTYFQYTINLTLAITTTRCRSMLSALQIRKFTHDSVSKEGIAVCVKGLDFLDDKPKRLVEWIEMQYMTGANAITVYTYHMPSRMQRVLGYYTAKTNFTQIPLILPGESPNQPYTRSRFIWRNRQQKRRHELIPYNDCFYRHIDTHKFILLLDVDEVVLSLKSSHWSSMLNEVLSRGNYKNEITSVSILNAFKFPSSSSAINSSSYMHFLDNRRISKKISPAGSYGKAFISTQSVATVFNHFALHRLHDNVTGTIYASEDVALKLHYKEKCPIESGKDCEELIRVTVEDFRMDRYAEELTRRVIATLQDLDLL